MRTSRRETLQLLAASGLAAATPAAAVALADSAAGLTTEWTPLFNGRDLAGWTFFQDGVGDHDRDGVVDCADGVMHILGPRYRGSAAPGMGYVATTREYGNYHLSLDYKWGTRRYEPRTNWKRDSGLLYHSSTGPEHLWPDCIEYQIMERGTGNAFPINHRAVAGISMGGVPAWPNNPPGLPYAPQINAGRNLRQSILADGDFENLDGWNTVELIAVGSKAAHIVNGRIVNTLFDMQASDPADRSKYHPVTSGRLLLQIECAEIMFRNVKIRAA